MGGERERARGGRREGGREGEREKGGGGGREKERKEYTTATIKIARAYTINQAHYNTHTSMMYRSMYRYDIHLSVAHKLFAKVGKQSIQFIHQWMAPFIPMARGYCKLQMLYNITHCLNQVCMTHSANTMELYTCTTYMHVPLYWHRIVCIVQLECVHVALS